MVLRVVIQKQIQRIWMSLHLSIGQKLKELQTKFEILDADKTGVNVNNNVVETSGLNYFTWSSIYMGSGVGVADFNNDGLPDIYMGSKFEKRDVLYLNKGNMQFEDISNQALPENDLWTSGVSIVDINNDGLMDIYVCKFGPTNGYGTKTKSSTCQPRK